MPVWELKSASSKSIAVPAMCTVKSRSSWVQFITKQQLKWCVHDFFYFSLTKKPKIGFDKYT